MNIGGTLLFLGIMGSVAWGDGTQDNLSRSRTQYQQAVAQHGPRSPEANEARNHLRDARRAFHAERRQNARAARPKR